SRARCAPCRARRSHRRCRRPRAGRALARRGTLVAAPQEATVSLVTATGIERRTLRLHGHDIAYRMAGDPADGRPVLLLVHGMAGSSTTWRDVMPSLARHATVVAPDLLGH